MPQPSQTTPPDNPPIDRTGITPDRQSDLLPRLTSRDPPLHLRPLPIAQPPPMTTPLTTRHTDPQSPTTPKHDRSIAMTD